MCVCDTPEKPIYICASTHSHAHTHTHTTKPSPYIHIYVIYFQQAPGHQIRYGVRIMHILYVAAHMCLRFFVFGCCCCCCQRCETSKQIRACGTRSGRFFASARVPCGEHARFQGHFPGGIRSFSLRLRGHAHAPVKLCIRSVWFFFVGKRLPLRHFPIARARAR